MTLSPYKMLSRREREILDIVYKIEFATVTAVREELESPPSYSAVRATLNVLKSKGVVTREPHGTAHVYRAVVARKQASRSVFKRILRTFFGGSAAKAVAGLIDASEVGLSPTERERILRAIREAEEGGR